MDFFESRLFWASLRLVQLLFTILTLGFTTYGISSSLQPVLARPTLTLNIVINWWNEYWSAAPPIPLGFLLFSSLITPFALTYLLIIPVYFTETAFYSPALIACIEGLMALAWSASSISTAVFISDKVCFGQVCDFIRAAVVLGVFQW